MAGVVVRVRRHAQHGHARGCMGRPRRRSYAARSGQAREYPPIPRGGFNGKQSARLVARRNPSDPEELRLATLK